MPTLDEQIRAAQERYAQAEQAERERIARETQARQQMAQAEAELRQLLETKEDQQINAMRTDALAEVSKMDTIAQDMIATLITANFDQAFQLRDQYLEQAKFASMKLQALKNAHANLPRYADSFQRAKAEAINHYGTDDNHDAQNYIHQHSRNPENDLRLPAIKPLLHRLHDWVSEVPDGKDRQVRRGLCYALTGWFCDQSDEILQRFSRTTY